MSARARWLALLALLAPAGAQDTPRDVAEALARQRAYLVRSPYNEPSNRSERSATQEARTRREKTSGQPCAGNPQARLARGPRETLRVRHRA
jgi:hypothetical protein